MRTANVGPGFFDLADVERSVKSLAPVSEVKVTVREDRQSELVVYVVPEPGRAPIDVVALRTALTERLPTDMVLAAIVVLEALPCTSRDTADAAALPAVPSSRPSLPREQLGPRDDLEAAIIWALENALEMSPIGVHDDFFALGADSLAVVEARTLIEQRLGREVSMAALLEASTPAELARLLRDGDDEWRGSSVVPLRTSGTRPPLFLVHGGGGNVLMWRDLAARLSPDQPVYGIQITETPPRFLTSVNRMAAYYVRQIREVQPQGPYLLGGLSAGGTVAMAMASQLAAANEQPALVVNFDGLAPHLVRGRFGRRFDVKLWSYAKLEVHWWVWRLRWVLWRLSQIARTEPSPSPWHNAKTAKRSSLQIVGRVLVRHRPRRYHGHVLQIRTRHYRWVELGWDRFVTSLDTITVPGEHTTMLGPLHVDIVAAHVDAAITSALGSAMPPAPQHSAFSRV